MFEIEIFMQKPRTFNTNIEIGRNVGTPKKRLVNTSYNCLDVIRLCVHTQRQSKTVQVLWQPCCCSGTTIHIVPTKGLTKLDTK